LLGLFFNGYCSSNHFLENTRNQINEALMGRICSVFGRDTYKMKETYAYSLGDLGVGGRIMLNRIINSSGSS
jgi:hypothetical protein